MFLFSAYCLPIFFFLYTSFLIFLAYRNPSKHSCWACKSKKVFQGVQSSPVPQIGNCNLHQNWCNSNDRTMTRITAAPWHWSVDKATVPGHFRKIIHFLEGKGNLAFGYSRSAGRASLVQCCIMKRINVVWVLFADADDGKWKWYYTT